jgi:hypothetical protein
MRIPHAFSDDRAAPLQTADHAVRAIQFRHHALILAAVLSLTIHVGTRFCQVNRAAPQMSHAAKAYSLDAQRQHLLNDGLHWCVPTTAMLVFEPTRVISSVLPAVFPLTRLRSEEALYSRPPPTR